MGEAAHPTYVNSLVSIVHKNLLHQADWSDLRIHSSPDLPRPLISGTPPEPVYADPDGSGIAGEKRGGSKVDREWVLPVHLCEKWSVRQWAAVFDSIPAEPPDHRESSQKSGGPEAGARAGDCGSTPPSPPPPPPQLQEGDVQQRKKRLVMGIVSGDSTVVYYIVHDGIVKPKQN